HTWPEITGLTADSRKVTAGVLYCAVTGSVQDGHGFVADARARGAAAALVEREQPVDLLQILVRDGRRAAALAAGTWYGPRAAPPWKCRRTASIRGAWTGSRSGLLCSPISRAITSITTRPWTPTSAPRRSCCTTSLQTGSRW